jgi:hypothetical protein
MEKNTTHKLCTIINERARFAGRASCKVVDGDCYPFSSAIPEGLMPEETIIVIRHAVDAICDLLPAYDEAHDYECELTYKYDGTDDTRECRNCWTLEDGNCDYHTIDLYAYYEEERQRKHTGKRKR